MNDKYCPLCYYYRPIGARFCAKCGFKFEKQELNFKETVDNTVKEINFVLKDDFFDKEKWK